MVLHTAPVAWTRADVNGAVAARPEVSTVGGLVPHAAGALGGRQGSSQTTCPWLSRPMSMSTTIVASGRTWMRREPAGPRGVPRSQ